MPIFVSFYIALNTRSTHQIHYYIRVSPNSYTHRPSSVQSSLYRVTLLSVMYISTVPHDSSFVNEPCVSMFCRLNHIIELLETGSVVDKQDMVVNLKYSIAVLDTLYIEETK